jgi:propionate catabolism operon transcriptional regulator
MAACAPLLQRYDWPGNVRELRNLTERLALFLAAEPLQALTPAFVLGVAPELAARHAAAIHALSPSPLHALSPASAATGPAMLPREESVAAVLARFGGRRDAAAEYLGISRTTLWRKLKAENDSSVI